MLTRQNERSRRGGEGKLSTHLPKLVLVSSKVEVVDGSEDILGEESSRDLKKKREVVRSLGERG